MVDALGAPPEFLSLPEIKKWYGRDGITDFDTWRGFQPGSYIKVLFNKSKDNLFNQEKEI
jgi:hypothetical protein